MYRLPFELTDSAKLLHFTILGGGSADPPCPPLNDATVHTSVFIFLHMAQLMPLPLTVSCFSKIQIGFPFLVSAHPGSPGKRAVKCVCVCRLLCGRRFVVGCTEFDWVVCWVGWWVGFHFAMGRVGSGWVGLKTTVCRRVGRLWTTTSRARCASTACTRATSCTWPATLRAVCPTPRSAGQSPATSTPARCC